MKIGKIIFEGDVIDTADIYRLGRIRVQPDNQLKKAILDSVDDKYLNSTKDEISIIYQWSKNDPFVYLPLLPFSLNITPKPKERVMLM